MLLHLVKELLARRQLRIDARVIHAQHVLRRAQVAGEEGPDEWLQLLREEACGRRRDKRKGEDELPKHVPEERHVQTWGPIWWRRKGMAEVGERRQVRKRSLGGGNGIQLVRELKGDQRFLEVVCSEWGQSEGILSKCRRELLHRGSEQLVLLNRRGCTVCMVRMVCVYRCDSLRGGSIHGVS